MELGKYENEIFNYGATFPKENIVDTLHKIWFKAKNIWKKANSVNKRSSNETD